MTKKNLELQDRIKDYLNILYGGDSKLIFKEMLALLEGWQEKSAGFEKRNWVNQDDIMLITYGDSIISDNVKPLITLRSFLNKYIKNTITAVHLLPMYPYTSDDGFSVVDYYEISDELGTWQDVNALSRDFDMMYDAVVNHISKSSSWFQGFLDCDGRYKDFFIQGDPSIDYSMVTRPRALPLLTAFETREGTKHVWTTFSEDQIDLNFKNPRVLLEIVNVLLHYANNGARFIRLDAIGFAWKEIGATCMHLTQTHAIVKLMRATLDLTFPGTILITETNVPHDDNISYFGNGCDEAQMVYQFPLPPLVLFSFLTGNASKLSQWAKSLEGTQLSQTNTYFNFLASHDGIGMRPVENILDEQEKNIMLQSVIKHGGNISYKQNSDGSKSPYELNINYLDALTDPNTPDMKSRIDRFIAAQCILLSMIGVPGIYIHSLLGSQNWYEGVKQSGIYRRINREKLDCDRICNELEDERNIRNMVFSRFSKLIFLRRKQSAFAPKAAQNTISLDSRAFSFLRHNNETHESMLVIVNVSYEEYSLQLSYKGHDIINDEKIDGLITMLPYQTRWIKL